MTLIIVFMLIMGYLLIATGHLTGVNKAAIAMFIGTVGWVVYICWGTDFVTDMHPDDYAEFLNGIEPTSDTVKDFIHVYGVCPNNWQTLFYVQKNVKCFL